MWGANHDLEVVSKRREGNRGRRLILAFATVAIALYAPFAWLIQLDFTSNSYHYQWLRIWPILPGFLAGVPLKRVYDDAGLFVGSGIATAILLILLTIIGTRFRYGLLLATAVALVVSIPTSLLAYWVFRQ